MTKKIFFASDFHLGLDLVKTSKEREEKVVRWLNTVSAEADQLFLLGDIFDFWFEYRRVIPKGYTRLLGKLAQMSDEAIKIHLFTGNHDSWMFDYFQEELGIDVHHQPQSITLGNHTFFVGHGDGLGSHNRKYKFIKSVFRNRVSQSLFAMMHPNVGLSIMKYFSRKSREKNEALEEYNGVENEWQIQFCESYNTSHQHDYYIFGHRHIPMTCGLSNGHSRYFNIGDWMKHFSYGVYDGQTFEIKFFENDKGQITRIT